MAARRTGTGPRYADRLIKFADPGDLQVRVKGHRFDNILVMDKELLWKSVELSAFISPASPYVVGCDIKGRVTLYHPDQNAVEILFSLFYGDRHVPAVSDNIYTIAAVTNLAHEFRVLHCLGPAQGPWLDALEDLLPEQEVSYSSNNLALVEEPKQLLTNVLLGLEIAVYLGSLEWVNKLANAYVLVLPDPTKPLIRRDISTSAKDTSRGPDFSMANFLGLPELCRKEHDRILGAIFATWQEELDMLEKALDPHESCHEGDKTCVSRTYNMMKETLLHLGFDTSTDVTKVKHNIFTILLALKEHVGDHVVDMDDGEDSGDSHLFCRTDRYLLELALGCVKETQVSIPPQHASYITIGEINDQIRCKGQDECKEGKGSKDKDKENRGEEKEKCPEGEGSKDKDNKSEEKEMHKTGEESRVEEKSNV